MQHELIPIAYFSREMRKLDTYFWTENGVQTIDKRALKRRLKSRLEYFAKNFNEKSKLTKKEQNMVVDLTNFIFPALLSTCFESIDWILDTAGAFVSDVKQFRNPETGVFVYVKPDKKRVMFWRKQTEKAFGLISKTLEDVSKYFGSFPNPQTGKFEQPFYDYLAQSEEYLRLALADLAKGKSMDYGESRSYSEKRNQNSRYDSRNL